MNRHGPLAFFRIFLGVVQMTMSLVTLGLYFQSGTTVWSVGALIATLLLVLGSRLIFESDQTVLLLKTMKKYFSEFLGTFCLVFAGTGAIVINQTSGGVISHVGIAITFGLVVMAMIYTFGDISGAHLNPAVTCGFVAARRMQIGEGAFYIVSQLGGAIAASAVMRFLFPQNATLGMTQPAGSEMQSFVLELLLTAILMLVILSVSVGAKEKGITAGIAIGGVIALEAMFAGPVSGASMNPARSLGPALMANNFGSFWLYLAAPIAGALLAVPLCICVREKGCCSTKAIVVREAVFAVPGKR